MKTIVYSLVLLFALFSSFDSLSQNRLPESNQLPVLAWMGVPASETSEARFAEMKNLGITMNFVHYPNISALEKALVVGAKTGVKIVASCPELLSDTENTVKRIMNHPALAGYYIRDEPSTELFAELGDWVRKIRTVDDKHFCYLNLFPTYASKEQLGAASYTEYVELFVKEIPVQFISYDHYPLMKNRVANKDYYENIEIIRKIAEKEKLPVWAFGLSTAFHEYAVPTIGELKFQIYSVLAYGSQAIQYFTYWTPPSTTWDFHHAPISVDGRRTITYDRVKAVNDEVQRLSAVFVGSKVVSLGHTGDKLPQGVLRLHTLPAPVTVLETQGEGAIVSLLEKGDDQYLVIVNRDHKNPMNLVFGAEKHVMKVLKDGTLVPASAYANSMEVDAGDAVIYTWKKSKN
jgi:hypothetical protein